MPTLVNNLRAIRGPVTAVPMVGQSGVVVEPDTVNNQVVVRADETVLCSTTISPGNTTESLSESALNFKLVRMRCISRDGAVYYAYFDPAGLKCKASITDIDGSNIRIQGGTLEIAANGLSITLTNNYQLLGSTLSKNDGRFYCMITEIVGINRIANN